MVDEVDALLDAYPASFGQLLDAAVHRHVPPGFEQEASGQGLTAVGLDPDAPTQNPDSSSGSGDKTEGPGGQDNIARLKALLSEQQQRKSPKQLGSPAGAGSPAAAGSSASLAAAAVRLEGLLAAPAAAPVGQGDEAAPAADQQQQQGQQQDAGSSGQQQEQGAALASSSSSITAAELAAQIPADYDEPMPKPQVVLVGATVSDEDIALALNRGWAAEPVIVRVGAEGSVPAGLKHRAIVVSQQQQRLGGLVASLRRDLTGALAAADAAAAAAQTGDSSSKQQQPVRVIIFARSETEARAAAEPLRAALWGDHMLSVLLPSTGAEPVKAITAFRDRVASLLLATPSAARGLDLPAVSHVYSLGLPQVGWVLCGSCDNVGRSGLCDHGGR